MHFLVDDNGQVLDKEAHGSDNIQGHNVLFRNSALWIITKYIIHVIASECKYLPLLLQLHAFD